MEPPEVHIVQFTHPGPEHGPDKNPPGHKSWNRGAHRRKFMCAPGDYVADNGRLVHGENLLFWGEWEPDSHVERMPVRPDDLHPQWLHRPYLRVSASGMAGPVGNCATPVRNTKACLNPCGGGSGIAKGPCQNTDPFVFGDCFKYFICKQIERKRANRKDPNWPLAGHTWLARLERGSLILFGSTHGTGAHAFFQLDTVFVVADSIAYNPAKPKNLAKDPRLDPGFVRAGLQAALPVTDCEVPDDLELRLYLGATIENPVNGMYSFSPAQVLDGKPRGFARVPLKGRKFEDHITGNLNSAARGRKAVPLSEVVSFWEMIRAASRRHGCVEGVRFRHDAIP